MSDFWARKLGGDRYGRSGRREISTYSPPTAPAAAAPVVTEYAPIQAAHMRQHIGACPNCASADYIRAGETIRPRCYTCGYPILHSTSGMKTPGNKKKATAARQIALSMEGNFSPQTIIGRIE